MRSVYTSNRERLQERNERLTRIVRKQTNLIRGYENNLDDLVP